MVFLVSKVQGYSVSIEYTLYRLLITWLCPFGTYINEVDNVNEYKVTQGCALRKINRKPSAWNLWNQGCLAYSHEFYEKNNIF